MHTHEASNAYGAVEEAISLLSDMEEHELITDNFSVSDVKDALESALGDIDELDNMAGEREDNLDTSAIEDELHSLESAVEDMRQAIRNIEYEL